MRKCFVFGCFFCIFLCTSSLFSSMQLINYFCRICNFLLLLFICCRCCLAFFSFLLSASSFYHTTDAISSTCNAQAKQFGISISSSLIWKKNQLITLLSRSYVLNFFFFAVLFFTIFYSFIHRVTQLSLPYQNEENPIKIVEFDIRNRCKADERQTPLLLFVTACVLKTVFWFYFMFHFLEWIASAVGTFHYAAHCSNLVVVVINDDDCRCLIFFSSSIC